MTKHETTPMRIGASAVVNLITREYEKAIAPIFKTHPRAKSDAPIRERITKRAEAAAVAIAREVLDESVPTAWILAIARGEATLCGYSDTGVTYHNAPPEVVGPYIPGRDDSEAPGWVQPEWEYRPDGGFDCWRGSENVTHWSPEQWAQACNIDARAAMPEESEAPYANTSPNTLTRVSRDDDGNKLVETYRVDEPATEGKVGKLTPISVEVVPADKKPE